MNVDEHRRVAEQIIAAHRAGHCLDASTVDIAPEDAYAIQSLMTASRRDRGQSVVGWKLGYTSAVMREQMGIDEPNLGPLTDAMMVTDGGLLPSATQPKVEPEVALIMGDGGVAEARLALEVVDSVWCDYRFTWAQNTADGSSAAYVVVGGALPLDGLASVGVDLVRNGEVVGHGTADAAMGDPLAALDWLIGQLAGRGERLRAGDVVITGGLCAAVPFEPGDVIEAHAGEVRVSVTRGDGRPPHA